MRILWRCVLAWIACAGALAWAQTNYAPVLPSTPLAFPRDFGAHPEHRIEWWYLTGWLDGERPLGFQLTFFRLRTAVAADHPSAFAPRQLLFAHAAIADPAHGRLRHAERSARAGFGLAEASSEDTRVRIDDWSLTRDGDAYVAQIRADDFAYALTARSAAPPLLQGEAGFSRKDRDPAHASHYYSRPQLVIDGWIEIDGRRREVRGTAWLDHEWSSQAMPAGAIGWDWLGINLDDGGALMAFRMRDAAGATLWSAGTLQRPGQPPLQLAAKDLLMTPLRRWRSPRTGGDYPVAMEVVAGPLRLRLEPLLDDQELDARRSVGAVYWEGAVRALDRDGRALGRGYLELTGYAGRQKL